MHQSTSMTDNGSFSGFTPINSENWRMPCVLPDGMEGFDLCQYLGCGSTGQVYKAVQTKEFAVKIIPWHSNNGREIAKHEFNLAQQFISCPEVLHSLEYYELDQQSFIVMEYGVPCLSYFSGRINSMRDILQTILNVSIALEAIHKKGYSHFDVKPDNIMMVKGSAKLADFSHCSTFISNQTYDRPLGTNVYMAPEIKVGGKFTGKEDMYSLGISMYALLMAGRLPFDFSNRETKYREKKDTIESLFIHPELLNIIQKAAAFDPNERYPDIHEFTQDIYSFIASHEKKLDEEIPLYRILPSFQQTENTIFSGSLWGDKAQANTDSD